MTTSPNQQKNYYSWCTLFLKILKRHVHNQIVGTSLPCVYSHSKLCAPLRGCQSTCKLCIVWWRQWGTWWGGVIFGVKKAKRPVKNFQFLGKNTNIWHQLFSHLSPLLNDITKTSIRDKKKKTAGGRYGRPVQEVGTGGREAGRLDFNIC